LSLVVEISIDDAIRAIDDYN